MDRLAQALWSGSAVQPRPVAAEYAPALAALRAQVGWALPMAPALAEARRRWPWSIDLARLWAEVTGDLEPLAHLTRAQNRRHAALARALWALGRCEAALAALDGLDPASETFTDDRATRAELRILGDLPAEAIPGPRGLHLSLLETWRREGATALARRVALESAALPAHPPLWSWLIDTWLLERDFARARAALAGFGTRCPDHPELAAQRIRLALETDDTARARALLNALPDANAPWRWSARRHVQHLRCLADEIAAQPAADPAPLRAQAQAALRLHPRHGALQGLMLRARELTEDWDDLAASLAEPGDTPVPARAAALIRLGYPDRALALLDTPPDGPPDEALRHRLRRAEARLRSGDSAGAAEALGPVPVAAPLAADHAYWRAEIAAARRDLGAAQGALAPARASSPTRMGLILTGARVAFLGGDAAAATGDLHQFRALKVAQLGHDPGDDLRDRIVRDALDGAEDSPARCARRFAQATPAFRPDSGPPIPPRIAHYWEGPRSAPLDRSLRAWAGQFPQTLYDATSARAWLDRHAPELGAAFDRLTQPAARADLFRVALIAQEGGLFADLDEFPRAPVADWLTGAAALLVIEEGHGTIANNFLAARPGMPLFSRLARRIADTLARVQAPYPWWDTGPAPLTAEAFADRDTPGLRFLTQPEYETRVATNLPFPHKRSPDHWR